MADGATDLRLVTVTFPDAETAVEIARTLVADGLTACVNVLPGVRSVYRWQGAVEEAAEVLALMKTTARRAADLVDAIRARHPYALPAIEILPVAGAGEGVAEWVAAATSG